MKEKDGRLRITTFVFHQGSTFYCKLDHDTAILCINNLFLWTATLFSCFLWQLNYSQMKKSNQFDQLWTDYLTPVTTNQSGKSQKILSICESLVSSVAAWTYQALVLTSLVRQEIVPISSTSWGKVTQSLKWFNYLKYFWLLTWSDLGRNWKQEITKDIHGAFKIQGPKASFQCITTLKY